MHSLILYSHYIILSSFPSTLSPFPALIHSSLTFSIHPVPLSRHSFFLLSLPSFLFLMVLLPIQTILHFLHLLTKFFLLASFSFPFALSILHHTHSLLPQGQTSCPKCCILLRLVCCCLPTMPSWVSFFSPTYDFGKNFFPLCYSCSFCYLALVLFTSSSSRFSYSSFFFLLFFCLLF